MYDRDSSHQIACMILPRFMWQIARREDESLADKPVMIASDTAKRGHRIVTDVSPAVSGVVSGIPLEQALSRHPDAVVVDADVPAAEALFDDVLSALEQVVPEVEPAGLGVAYLAAHGLERLYHGDAGLVKAISTAVRQVCPLDLRIGIGSSKWLAYVAAIHSKPNCAYKLTGSSDGFLKGLPVSLLPIDPKTVLRMEGFGLAQLGDISSKPRSAISAQFGPDGARAWDLSKGIDHSPLVPRQSAEQVSEYLEFSDATVNLMTIIAGIESLLSRAFSRSTLNNRHARRCSLQAHVFESTPWTLEVAFKEPAGSARDALFAVKAKLDTVAIPGPLEDLRVTLLELIGEAARQESMWLDVKRQSDLWEAMAQLQERIGEPPPVYRVQELKPDSKVPEWRSALVQLSR